MLSTHLTPPREINDEPVRACISLATLCDNASRLGEQESITVYSRTSLCYPEKNFEVQYKSTGERSNVHQESGGNDRGLRRALSASCMEDASARGAKTGFDVLELYSMWRSIW